MTARLHRYLPFVALLLLFAACSKHDPGPAPVKPEDTTTHRNPVPWGAADSGRVVKAEGGGSNARYYTISFLSNGSAKPARVESRTPNKYVIAQAPVLDPSGNGYALRALIDTFSTTIKLRAYWYTGFDSNTGVYSGLFDSTTVIVSR